MCLPATERVRTIMILQINSKDKIVKKILNIHSIRCDKTECLKFCLSYRCLGNVRRRLGFVHAVKMICFIPSHFYQLYFFDTELLLTIIIQTFFGIHLINFCVIVWDFQSSLLTLQKRSVRFHVNNAHSFA